MVHPNFCQCCKFISAYFKENQLVLCIMFNFSYFSALILSCYMIQTQTDEILELLWILSETQLNNPTAVAEFL